MPQAIGIGISAIYSNHVQEHMTHYEFLLENTIDRLLLEDGTHLLLE